MADPICSYCYDNLKVRKTYNGIFGNKDVVVPCPMCRNAEFEKANAKLERDTNDKECDYCENCRVIKKDYETTRKGELIIFRETIPCPMCRTVKFIPINEKLEKKYLWNK